MNSHDLFIRMKFKFHTSLEKYFVFFSAPSSQLVLENIQTYWAENILHKVL